MENYSNLIRKKFNNSLSSHSYNLLKKLLKYSDYSKKNQSKIAYPYSYSKKSLNLLFSIDQFFFEFTKKFPQRKRISEFKLQLKERKKFSLFYGSLSKKQLSEIFNQSNLYKGHSSKKVLSLLERRLDVILFRSNFVKNIITARQLISHKKILVNSQNISSPSYLLSPGDIISIVPQDFSKIGPKIIESIKLNRNTGDSSTFVTVNTFKRWTSSNSILSKVNLHLFVRLLSKKIQHRATIIIKSSFNEKNPVKLKKDLGISIQNQSKLFLKLIRSKQNILSIENPIINIFSGFSLVDKFLNNQKVSYDKNIIQKYRNFLLALILGIYYKKFSRELFVLMLKKYLAKKLLKRHILDRLNLAGMKPLNLEISYKLLKIIFLYSPQRLYYPFFIDLDLIKRSCKK